MFRILHFNFMDCNSVYAWAKRDVLRETSFFTFFKFIEQFCHAQTLSLSGIELDVCVVPCVPDEPVCRDCRDEKPFWFLYETLFIRLGVRLRCLSF